VTHADQSAESNEASRRWWDFAVRHGDLLFDAGAVDVTAARSQGVNEELRVDAPVPVSVECAPGSLWVRAVQTSRGLLVHLIDLSPQQDDRWNEPKAPGRPLAGVTLRVEQLGARRETVSFADPDDAPELRALEPARDGRHDVYEVPPFRTWALLWIRDGERS
jgi:hypothetical protein